MSERRQVAAVGGHETDAGGHRFAGRRVDDLDLDATRRRWQRLDGDPAARTPLRPRPGGRSPATRALDPIASRRVRRHRQVDERTARRVVVVRGTPQPTTPSLGAPGRGSAGAGRWRKTCPRSTPTCGSSPLGRRRSAASAAARSASGEAVPRNAVTAADDDAAALVEPGERLHPQSHQPAGGRPGSRSRTARRRCRRSGSAPNPRRRSGPGPSCPGRMPEQPGLAGRGVAGRRRQPDAGRASRAARRPGAGCAANAPCPQPTMPSLTSNRRRTIRSTTGPDASSTRVAGERLADRRHPADRQVGGPPAGGVPPGIAEVGDDDVAGRPARARRSTLGLPVEQQPARRSHPRRRSANGSPRRTCRARRQPADRVAVRRMEGRGRGRRRWSVARTRAGRPGVASAVASRGVVTRSVGRRVVAPQGPSHPPPTRSLTLPLSVC